MRSSASSLRTPSSNTSLWLAISLALLLLAAASAPNPAIAQAPTPFAGFSDTGSPDGAGAAGQNGDGIVEKPLSALSDQNLTTLGQKALSIRPNDWKHAETEDFILHFRRVTEAKIVAREIEFDLHFVAAALGAEKSQYAKKGHVFIFEDDNDWQTFISQTRIPPWSLSFAVGGDLYLNLRNNGSGDYFDSRTLAHETTHLTVFRIYHRYWPLWLSEGFAEYMGAAAVAARTHQTIKLHEHSLDFATMSLDDLQNMRAYPDDVITVAKLYESAEKLVRFIMTDLPPERFTQFVNAMLNGQSLQQALQSVYSDKVSSYDDFQKAYAHFDK